MRILVADDHELFLKGLEFILRDNFPALNWSLPITIPRFSKLLKKKRILI